MCTIVQYHGPNGARPAAHGGALCRENPRQQCLRVALDDVQVVFAREALRVELVDVFRAGGTRREPSFGGAQRAEGDLAGERPPRSPVEPSPSAALRILLAEDNKINQFVARRLLEKHGHTVTVAGNGYEAVSLLDREAFDVVLMDVQMPDMDGFEATAAIRVKENGTGRHIPIIAMTAHAMKGDQERCLQAGMDGYVPKPITPAVLFSAIEAARGVRVPDPA